MCVSLNSILISIQRDVSIGVYLENRIGYKYEWLIDFLNQFTAEAASVEELLVLIDKIKTYALTTEKDLLANQQTFYSHNNSNQTTSFFLAGDMDGTKLTFLLEANLFQIDNCFVPNSQIQISVNQLIVWLEEWVLCLKNTCF